MKKKINPVTVNVKLLRQIKSEILKRPTQFNMDWWFQPDDSKGDDAGGCGTAETAKGAAKLAAARIDYFIKHGK